MSERDRSQIFMLGKEFALGALARWLDERSYNEHYEGPRDRCGFRMIGLTWRESPAIWRKRGLVVVKDDTLYDRALKLVAKHQGAAMRFSGARDLFITTPTLRRRLLSECPGMSVMCSADGGWTLINAGRVIASEHASDGKPVGEFRLDVAGSIIFDSITNGEPE